VQQQVFPTSAVPAAHTGCGALIPNANTAIRICKKPLKRTITLPPLQQNPSKSSLCLCDASGNGPNGANPYGALLQASDGNFYGTTDAGGSTTDAGAGTAFRLTLTDDLTTLAVFTGPNGLRPESALTQGIDGNFYGTTSEGTSNDGTLFRLTPSGTLTTLTFTGVGADTTTNLLRDSNGNLYGATTNEDTSGKGFIFELTPSGSLIDLISIPAPTPGTSQSASSLIMASDGSLYGTTSAGGSAGGGVVYKLGFTPQAITFANIPNHTLGDAPFTIVATASSGLPVSFQVSRPASVNGSTVTLAGAGDVTIMASQSGDGTYAAATTVAQSFTVTNVTAQTITFPQIPSHTYGDASFAAGASAGSGLPVSYQIISGPATVSGNLITLTGAATVKITASQVGNGTYAAATPVTQTFTVVPASQTINFPAISPQHSSEGSFTVAATASSDLPVSYEVDSGPATVSGNTVTLTGAGTVKLKAYQHGNTNYTAAISVTQSFSVIGTP